ncbi:MAG TPA: 30S ribosomal protein S4 [Candidatus Paceibacterota bacterium]
MIRHPRYKIGRRLGSIVYEKCQTPKFALAKERTGVKDRRPRGKSEFGTVLLEKQRARLMYGVPERQFKRYVQEIIREGGANQGEALYKKLETRIDNTVFRLGLAPTRAAARQMVSHGHILVNSIKLTIPSQEIEEGDTISIRQGSLNKKIFSELENKLKEVQVPNWLKIDVDKKEAKAAGLPRLDQGAPLLNWSGILDFYKR